MFVQMKGIAPLQGQKSKNTLTFKKKYPPKAAGQIQ
jgi:hypothetical protein